MKLITDIRDDIIETTETDNLTGKVTVKQTQDVAPYLAQNEREKSNQVTGWKGDLHKVASVPLVLIEKWCKELGCNILKPENRHLLMLKLNDSAYSKLRTKEGRV